MNTAKLIAAIEKLAFDGSNDHMAAPACCEDICRLINSHMENSVIVPVDDLKLLIKRDTGTHELDAYCLAMGPAAMVDHVQAMIATVSGEG